MMLFFCISVAICAALDVSSIVLTFQVAMLIVVLVSRSFGVVASHGLSPLCVIRDPVGPPSCRHRTEFLGSLVFVSVAKSVVVLGEYSLHPPPEVLILLLSVISEDFEFRGQKLATSRFFQTIVLVTKDAKTANNWNAHKRKVTLCHRRPKQQTPKFDILN